MGSGTLVAAGGSPGPRLLDGSLTGIPWEPVQEQAPRPQPQRLPSQSRGLPGFLGGPDAAPLPLPPSGSQRLHPEDALATTGFPAAPHTQPTAFLTRWEKSDSTHRPVNRFHPTDFSFTAKFPFPTKERTFRRRPGAGEPPAAIQNPPLSTRGRGLPQKEEPNKNI